MTHTDILNLLAEKIKAKSYLEIGINRPENNFDKIRCDVKVGVDPALSTSPASVSSKENGDVAFRYLHSSTSDKFFETPFYFLNKPLKWDLVFLDGLHEADQVKRDFENSLRCLNDNGFILIHDVLPIAERTTCVPRGFQREWHGDVYKWAMTLGDYDGIDFTTFDVDNGCCLVWKDKAKKGNGVDLSDKYIDIKMVTVLPARKEENMVTEINWMSYQMYGKEFMRVTDLTPEQFLQNFICNQVA